MKLKVIIITLFIPLVLPLNLRGKTHFNIKGKYLLFSYDHNYIFGKGDIVLNFDGITVQGEQLHVNLVSKQVLLIADCRIKLKDQLVKADSVRINLVDYSMETIHYDERITTTSLNQTAKEPAKKKPAFSPLRLKKLKESLLYFIGPEMVVKKNSNVIGKMVTIFIEGMESIAFKKIRMNQGLGDSQSPFSLDKLWYYDSLGIVTEMSLRLKKKFKKLKLTSDSALKFNYDLFNTRSYGTQGNVQLDLKNSIVFSPESRLNLNFNHITENITGGNLQFNFKPFKILGTQINIDYKKPVNAREEIWFEVDSDLFLKKYGTFSANLSYEKENQYKSVLSYNNNSIKNLSFSLTQSNSKLLLGTDSYKELSNSRFSIAYSSKLFNFSANYSLNKDLLRNYTQSNPQINLTFLPFTLYNKLLTLNINSSIDINNINNAGTDIDTFKANIGAMISSKELHLTDTTIFNFSLGIEQLLEKNNTDYTTTGFVLKGKQNFLDFADLEIIYNYNTRRESAGWFINGTSSEDISSLLRIRGIKNLEMWGSLSYNPKIGNFTSSYFDFKLKVIKKWYFQALLKYDFEFKNFFYDLFLTRQAGRLLIRLTYRSLSEQFQIEIVSAK